MNIEYEILEIHKKLGRIEGLLEAMQFLPERVSALEKCQEWLKGGCAILAAGFAYVMKGIFAK